MLKSLKHTTLALLIALLFAGCAAEENYPGVEYSPQMYHSVPYEPYSQFTDEDLPTTPFWAITPNSMPINDYGLGENQKHVMNVMLPVEGTVKRQMHRTASIKGQAFFYDHIHPDSAEQAGRVLQNPLWTAKTPEAEKAAILEDGQVMFETYCAPCHGVEGDGKGKVGEKYTGVANLKGRAYKNLAEGHIFHVITHGRKRMWSHKSQLNPEERWKVVSYIKQTIQK